MILPACPIAVFAVLEMLNLLCERGLPVKTLCRNAVAGAATPLLLGEGKPALVDGRRVLGGPGVKVAENLRVHVVVERTHGARKVGRILNGEET